MYRVHACVSVWEWLQLPIIVNQSKMYTVVYFLLCAYFFCQNCLLEMISCSQYWRSWLNTFKLRYYFSNYPSVFLAGSMKLSTLWVISDSWSFLSSADNTFNSSQLPKYNHEWYPALNNYVFQIIVEYLHLDNFSVNWPKSAL